MKKTILPILFILVLSAFSLAAVQSLNYPANGEYVAQSKIELNVTSGAGTTGCYWNYNNVRNQTIECNGTTQVTLPLKNAAYNITVGDSSGATITNIVYLSKANTGFAYFITIICILALMTNLFLIVYNIMQLGTIQSNINDLLMNWAALFIMIVFNFLFEEYVAITYMMNILNTLQIGLLWTSGVLPGISAIVCGIIRSMNPRFYQKMQARKKNEG